MATSDFLQAMSAVMYSCGAQFPVQRGGRGTLSYTRGGRGIYTRDGRGIYKGWAGHIQVMGGATAAIHKLSP